MIKFITSLLSLAAVMIHMPSVQAAQVEVKWSNPDKYTDIKAGEGHRKKFQEQTFKTLDAHFAKMAKMLPEQQQLIIKVTNLDLAGDVNYGMKRIRIIKDIFTPRMKFSYQLLNADKAVVKSEDVALNDMGFLMHNNLKYRNESLAYEKKMLDDWFRKTFANSDKSIEQK